MDNFPSVSLALEDHTPAAPDAIGKVLIFIKPITPDSALSFQQTDGTPVRLQDKISDLDSRRLNLQGKLDLLKLP